jgi:O-succinylbenzoate synthase
MGLDLEKELKFLLNFLGLIKDLSIQLRLDFNERLNPIEADSFFKKLMPLQSQIEFIEDPTPYHPGIWKRLQEHGGIPLALDRNWNFFLKNPEKKAVSILVLKPAIQDPKGVIKIADKLKIPIVVTSYLDHPVGQMYAAWVASEIKKNSEVSLLQCGIFSHLNYKKNHFSSEVRSMSNALQPPLGLGLGFDSLLNQISWLS